MSNFKNKFLIFIGGLILSLILMLPITYIYQLKNDNVLFFSGFTIAITASILGFCVWIKYFKEPFETVLVLLIYILFNTIFIYFGPVTLDRSLSSFIYFYSVENKEISSEIFNEEYFKPYIKRRFKDGEIFGFLKCENDICHPTLKTKITYYTLYPLGKITGTLKEYKNFERIIKKLPTKK